MEGTAEAVTRPSTAGGGAAQPRTVPRARWPQEAEEEHTEQRQRLSSRLHALRAEPAVLTGIPLDHCRAAWADAELKERVGDLKVSVHVSETQNLNFAVKNFAYAVMPLREFLERATQSGDRRYYYYRSQHAKRNKPSSLEMLGALADDFSLPPALLEGFTVHSTVLRIASCGLRMWLHYDICDNYLCCIRGRKRVVLLPPNEVGNLYVQGSSSAMGSRPLSTSEDGALAEELWREFPLAKAAWEARYEVLLEEGDVLFIPALWLHCTEAVPPAEASGAATLCMSVNVFLVKPEFAALHDAKDVWANRELLPAQEALKAFDEKMLPALRRVPPVHRSFYCRRAAAALLAMAEEGDAEDFVATSRSEEKGAS